MLTTDMWINDEGENVLGNLSNGIRCILIKSRDEQCKVWHTHTPTSGLLVLVCIKTNGGNGEGTVGATISSHVELLVQLQMLSCDRVYCGTTRK